MSSFNSIKKYVSRNSNTGNECTVNEALHFGMGLYIYTDIANKIGFNGIKKSNNAFTGVQPEQLGDVLRKLLEYDGYLIIDNN